MSILRHLKRILTPVLHGIGVDIVRYPPAARAIERPISRPFNVLEFLISDLAARHRKPFFIQVGANNGIRWDPLRDLIRKHHLPGLLIEPLPDIFDELKKNYASEPQLLFEGAALAKQDGFHTLFRVRADAPVGDWAQGIASFNKSHLENHLKGETDGYEQWIEEVTVPTISVASLLTKHSISEVALLQIDTEGYDFEILKMFFDAGVLPDVVNFERVHLSFEDQQASRRLLIQNGYRFIDVGIDTLGIRATLTTSSEPEDR
ncbi:MAG: FkbM family methyltransferase [Thiobacillus sp.]